MGRGKGFYDRFLARCPAPKIGICFHYQLVDQIPCEEHDIRMDCVVSNRKEKSPDPAPSLRRDVAEKIPDARIAGNGQLRQYR